MEKILLALAVTFSLAACGGGISSTEAEEGNETAAVTVECDDWECRCDGASCANVSCGDAGGDYCWNGGPWPRGYEDIMTTYDCHFCLRRGPSCGDLGGTLCLQGEVRAANGGLRELGSTWDCVTCMGPY